LAAQISQACFERGLIIETAGIDDQVLKLLPSLTASEDDLNHGLDIIEQSLQAVMQQVTVQA
jgi:diaminobutyrate-2-oxoglutarate transaminase